MEFLQTTLAARIVSDLRFQLGGWSGADIKQIWLKAIHHPRSLRLTIVETGLQPTAITKATIRQLIYQELPFHSAIGTILEHAAVALK